MIYWVSDKPHYENVPFEIPETWEWCRLGEISNYGQTSHTDVNHIGKSDWILELEDIEKDSGRLMRKISRFERNISGVRSNFTKGTILYSKLRTYLNKVLVAPDNGYCTTEIIPFYCIGNINHFYIAHVLRSQYFIDYTELCCYGCKMPRLSTDDARKGFIPLPPLAEQQRIVVEVEKWFAIIDALEANKEDLKDYIKQVKSKVLSLAISGKLVPQDPNDEPAIELLKRINPNFKSCDTSHYENLPAGWSVSTIGEVAQYINGRAFKPTEWEKEGIPIIRIQNLNDPNAPYNYSTVNYEEKYLIKDGDLLFAWAASLGAYVWKGSLGWLNQHIFKVEPKEFMNKQYLYYSFMNLIADFYRQSHGSGMVHITKGKFESTPILIPPLYEQERINITLENIFNILDNIRAES